MTLLLKKIILVLFILFAPSCAFFTRPVQPIFHWPVKNPKLTQKFFSFKRPPHLGIDLKASVGTTVFSSHSGRVIYTGSRLTNYGNVVVVEYSSKWATLYAHLQKIKVKVGQRVRRGDVIGTSGNTGHTTGPHLHFELMYNKKPIDPLPYLKQRELF